MLIGAIAAILAGGALAAGVGVGLTSSSSPDKSINFENPDPPAPWANAVGYDNR